MYEKCVACEIVKLWVRTIRNAPVPKERMKEWMACGQRSNDDIYMLFVKFSVQWKVCGLDEMVWCGQMGASRIKFMNLLES